MTTTNTINKKDDFDIDHKTKAVFTKKGYEILAKIGSGAFGQVSYTRLEEEIC